MSSITKDLRQKSNEELQNMILDLKAKLLSLRFASAKGEADKPHLIKEIKSTIARAFTIIKERELANSKEAK